MLVIEIMWPTSQSDFYLSFIFIIMKYMGVIFLMKYISICNDQVNYDEIIIQ